MIFVIDISKQYCEKQFSDLLTKFIIKVPVTTAADEHFEVLFFQDLHEISGLIVYIKKNQKKIRTLSGTNFAWRLKG